MLRNMLLVVTVFCTLLAAAGCKKETPVAPPQPTAQQYFNQGLSLYQQERFPEAASYFENAVAMKADYVDAFVYLGLSYWKQNMLQRAEEALVRAANLQPNNLAARESLGLLLFFRGNLDQARQQLEAARALGSIDPSVYSALGTIYLEQNRCDDALAAFKRALELNSSYLPAKEGQDRAKAKCGGKKPAAPKKTPQPTPQTEFKGGAKALNPADF